MKTKLFIVALSFSAILLTSCVKDEIFKDKTIDSDVTLLINEVASNNGDPNPDWVEIYNPSDVDVDISGFGIYDKPAAIYTIPDGTTIAAKGYFVLVCDVALAGGDPATYGAFGLSSGGESVFLVDPNLAIVDQVDFPALSVGVSYARIPDGGDVLQNSNPTKGSANSNTNEAPVITATLIANVDDNSDYDFVIAASDAGGVRDVKLYIEAGSEVKFIEMAPIGGGFYKYRFPAMAVGTVVKYYVVATDETAKKSYFPETAPNTSATFTVVNGAPKFVSVVPSNENPGDAEAINFTVKTYDKTGVKEVRLYYVLNDALAATKVTIVLTTTDNVTFTGTIPGQPDLTKISYYLRAEDNASSSLKTYYPTETVVDGVVTSTFNHDIASTWPSITVAPLVPLNQLVINEIYGAGSPDYIELYNGTSSSIDLGGYKLHDSNAADAYTFAPGTTIPAGGFVVLDCDGNFATGGITKFKISSVGEDITLLSPTDVVVDQLLLANWPVGHAALVGRKIDAGPKWVIKTVQTKGTTNN